MKKGIIGCILLSFLITGIAFAEDELVVQGTNQFTPYQSDEREPSIKALIGSEQLPIVDNADIRNPNFIGEREGIANRQVLPQRERIISSPSRTTTPTGANGVVSPVSP